MVDQWTFAASGTWYDRYSSKAVATSTVHKYRSLILCFSVVRSSVWLS
jgi:hypothetical protein